MFTGTSKFISGAALFASLAVSLPAIGHAADGTAPAAGVSATTSQRSGSRSDVKDGMVMAETGHKVLGQIADARAAIAAGRLTAARDDLQAAEVRLLNVKQLEMAGVKDQGAAPGASQIADGRIDLGGVVDSVVVSVPVKGDNGKVHMKPVAASTVISDVRLPVEQTLAAVRSARAALDQHQPAKAEQSLAGAQDGLRVVFAGVEEVSGRHAPRS